MTLVIERLDPKRHDRAGFRCEVADLERFLRELAAQHQGRSFSTTYVLIDLAEPRKILGYYSISFGSMALVDLRPEDRRRLPRHPVPAARMERLAVDGTIRRRGYGALLLQNAVRRCLAARAEIACYALVVDAFDDEVARFYEKYGFVACTARRRQLYLSPGDPA